MKIILVPLDFSETSINALNYAVGLANDLQANIVLMHTEAVQQPGNEFNMLTYPLNDNLKINLELLDKKAAEITQSTNFKGTVTTCAEIGGLTANIEAYIANYPVSFVVMGITGHTTQIGKMLLGSNAVSVSKHIKIPVFIIPTNYMYKKIENIAYASDMNDEINLSQVQYINDILASNLNVLHVIAKDHLIDKEEAATDLYMEEQLTHTNHKVYILSNDDVSNALLDFIKVKKMDLIIMEQKEYSFLHKLVYQSVTKEMAFNTPIPLLTLHS